MAAFIISKNPNKEKARLKKLKNNYTVFLGGSANAVASCSKFPL